MKTAPHITCVGEALVDFVATSNGHGLADAQGFLKCAGGATANLAVGLAKLGMRVAFAGKVGDDAFGRYLERELRRWGVGTGQVSFDAEHKTRLAFVSLDASGERDFEFWEHTPADTRLEAKDLQDRKLTASAIVHIGSFLLISEPSRSAALGVASMLRKRGVTVSFDPNLRLSLWRSGTEAREISLKMVRRAEILRLNEDEALFLAGTKTLAAAVKRLRSMGPRLIAVTKGSAGCSVYGEAGSLSLPGYRVRVVDTTGCGDGFLAGFLAGVLRAGGDSGRLSIGTLEKIGRCANAVGAITAMRRGAIAAMPTAGELEKFLKRHKQSSSL